MPSEDEKLELTDEWAMDPDQFPQLNKTRNERILQELAALDLPKQILTDLKPNHFDLDHDLFEQPILYARYGIMAAQAAAASEEAKSDLDRIEATIEPDVRAKLDQEGEKVTDAKVKAAIRRHPAYQSAVAERLEAYHHAQVMDVIKRAVEQKAQMLTMLISSRNKEIEMTR